MDIMNDKYQNKYRIKSARLEGYDYRQSGLYFITVCTHNREHYFGKIVDNEMQLSNIGILADVFWHEIKNHKNNIELHQFVVMPNHIHGILKIVDGGNGVGCGYDACRDDACIVSTMANPMGQMDGTDESSTNPQQSETNKMAAISPKSGSVSRVIGSYKSAVTKHAHRLGYEFKWQTRFYDHIIRNENDYFRISNYIKNNPHNWNNDKLNNGIGNIVMEPTAQYGDEKWMV